MSIDDGPPEQIFNKTKRLPVGPHTFRASVSDDKCCEPLHRTVEIKSDDGSGVPQKVSLSLSFRDAEIAASGAPTGAQLNCPAINISGPASRKFSYKMTALEEYDIHCDLDAPGVATRQRSVKLRAGDRTDVEWSPP